MKSSGAKNKAKTLFDHVNAIYTNQRVDYYNKLNREDKKSYNTYMINRFVSMNPDQVEVVNELQQYYGAVGDRESYLFYSQLIPKGKQWNKYIKAKKEVKYEDWLVRLVSSHYCVSSTEAKGYLDLLLASPTGKENLKSILEMYGTDPKKVRKVVR
jgi:hypothetical protein